jgi:hypothetical protein
MTRVANARHPLTLLQWSVNDLLARVAYDGNMINQEIVRESFYVENYWD